MIEVKVGESKDASTSAKITVNSNSSFGWTLHGQLVKALPEGITFKMQEEGQSNEIVPKTEDVRFASSDTSANNEEHKYKASVSISDAKPGTYNIDIDTWVGEFYTPPAPPAPCTNGAYNAPQCDQWPACTNGALNQPDCDQFPPCTNGATNAPQCNQFPPCTNGATNAPLCDFGSRLSTDSEYFSYGVTNFSGGDLIIKEDTKHSAAFSATPDENAIFLKSASGVSTECKRGNLNHSIVSAGYTAGTPNKIGCVLPDNLDDGTYSVEVAVASGVSAKVGEIQISKVLLKSDEVRADGLRKGQVAVIKDMRCQNNGGTEICGNVTGLGAGLYRVKKMPDNRVWMLDNLAYDPTNEFGGQPVEKIDNNSVTSKNTIPQFVVPYQQPAGHYYIAQELTEKQGYLYNWCATVKVYNCSSVYGLDSGAFGTEPNSILPSGFRLPTGTKNSPLEDYLTLNNSMTSAASNNPVYSTTWHDNFFNAWNDLKPGFYFMQSGVGEEGLVGLRQIHSEYWTNAHPRQMTSAMYLFVGDQSNFYTTTSYGLYSDAMSVRGVLQ